jgi:hypothetical protein
MRDTRPTGPGATQKLKDTECARIWLISNFAGLHKLMPRFAKK